MVVHARKPSLRLCEARRQALWPRDSKNASHDPVGWFQEVRSVSETVFPRAAPYAIGLDYPDLVHPVTAHKPSITERRAPMLDCHHPEVITVTAAGRARMVPRPRSSVDSASGRCCSERWISSRVKDSCVSSHKAVDDTWATMICFCTGAPPLRLRLAPECLLVERIIERMRRLFHLHAL